MCPKTFKDRRASLYLLSSYEKMSLEVIQNQKDHVLRKLASVLKEQIPIMPEGDIDTIRAWFVDPVNQPAIQAVTPVNLSNQQLTVIPSEIGALVELRELRLIDNLINEIPFELAILVKLRELNLKDNLINEIPPEIRALMNPKVNVIFSW